MNKINVGVVGATGMVGQRLLTLLCEHPYFNVTALAASARSAEKTYEEAVGGRWKLTDPIPRKYRNMTVINADDIAKTASLCSVIFCAVNRKKEEIFAMEEAYAKAEIPVISNNSANRGTPDVPMVIPEINPDHLALIEYQRRRLGTRRGFIVTKPNCSIQSFVPALTPLRKFGIEEVAVTTYQAISGAGKTFSEWQEMNDNVIPYIAGEEDKSEREPLRIWGRVENGILIPAERPLITSQCIRIPVSDGHTAAVFVRFQNKPTKSQILQAWMNFSGIPQAMGLPSAPKRFLTYWDAEDRPQAKQDRNLYGGMGISIGRLREDSLFDCKFIGLSHNTLRGAAGGAVLTAELLFRKGYFN